MKQISRHPLVKLPQKMDLSLYLICEELKSYKLFMGLQRAGLDHSPYRPNLDSAILRTIGLEDESNEMLDFYYTTLEKHAEKIEEDRDTIVRQALKVYHALRVKGKIEKTNKD